VRRTRRLAALAAAGTLLAVACSEGADPSASPTPRDTLTASPEDSPQPAPSDSLPPPAPSDSASPSPSPTGPAEPTDTDRARFIAGYSPEGASDLEHAAEDVDGDGIDEIVFVYARTGARVSHVDVAWWDADEQVYAIEWGDDGGPAERIERLRISDVNDDGRIELSIGQAVGSTGASLSLWRANEGVHSFQPLIASGGCHSGSNTYGVIGAELRNDDDDAALEVFATCDDSPLPPGAWNTDVYDWTDGVYAYSRTELADR